MNSGLSSGILIAIPALTGVGFTPEQYAVYASSAPSPMPARELAVLLANTLWFPALGLLALGLLLYPTGSLASERWRPVAWLLGASILALSLLFTSSAHALTFTPVPSPNLNLDQLGRVAFAGDFDSWSSDWLRRYHDGRAATAADIRPIPCK